MKVINANISDIKPYKNNPRDNRNAVEPVAESLKEFGWQQPIVVDKDMVIIVGHTRYLAAKKLGMKQVPITVASNLTPEQVKAYRLADNKTSDFSIWDNKKLLDEIDDIPDDIFTGFDESDIFDDVLDESDTSPLEEIDKGITYTINFKTQDKKLYNKIKEFIDKNNCRKDSGENDE